MSLSVSARNVNPRHKLTITMANYVLQTQVGQAIHAELMHLVPKFNYIYGCTTRYVNHKCEKKRAYKLKRNMLIMHIDFHSSSNEYLAWVMVQAMAKMVYSKKYELDKYSVLNVVEVEQLSFLAAQKFWEELNPPMRNDLDLYYSDEFPHRDNLARRLDLSINQFTRSFDQRNLFPFFNKVAVRASKYDGITRSAADIINGNYSQEVKNIAKNIIHDLYDSYTRIETY
jgi:hypothetical protein